jgi:hypothetical protein
MSEGEIPYSHRGEAMDPEHDYAANDGAKKTSSPFIFFLLFPRAIHITC